MQPDMMKMAQQSQASPQQGPSANPTREEVAAIIPNDEQLKQLGLPAGQDKETIKKRFMIIFEEMGFLEKLNPQGLKELQVQLDEYVDLMLKQDIKAIQAHPITKMLKDFGNLANQPAPGPMAAPAPATAPATDYASMVKPPAGGGMSGR